MAAEKAGRSQQAKPRFARQLADRRRRELLEATIECLKRFGHAGLSVRRISAQARVSIGLINHHFPNKDELIAQAYRHFNIQLVAGLQSATAQASGSPRERLLALFRACFSPPNLDRDDLSAWVVFCSLYRHSQPIQAVHAENYHSNLSLLLALLGELEGEAGRFTLGLRPAAIGLTALLDGLWLEWCLEPQTFKPQQAVAICAQWIDRLR